MNLSDLPETDKQRLRDALRLQQEGQLDAAGALCEAVLSQFPDVPDACHLLGVIRHLQGHADAVAWLQRATTLRPTWAEAHNNLGNARFAAGQLEEAALAYARAFELKPSLAEALDNLGNVRRLQGRVQEAEQCYREAIRINPSLANAHNDLGGLLRDQRRLDEAREALEHAHRLAPESPVVLNNLGHVLVGLGDATCALDAFKAALKLAPAFAEAHYGLGNVFWLIRDIASAAQAYAAAVTHNPLFVEGWNNLGNAQSELGKPQEAEACFREALRIRPDYAEGWNNLGTTLNLLNRTREAKQAFAQAIELRPDYAKAYNNLGKTLMLDGLLSDAAAAVKRALALKPDVPAALSNLGYIRFEQGRHREGQDLLRRALALNPDWAAVHSSLLFRLCYDPDIRPDALFAEHRAWDARFGRPHAVFVHRAPAAPERRALRIGYVSADFAQHPVGYLMLGVLRSHDREAFRIYAYSNRFNEDAMTAAIREQTDVWRFTLNRTDDELAAMIRDDGIDILVDLSGHTGGNRLSVFTRRPAPIQVTWLGYCETTGTDAMDYILMDEITAPPEAHQWFSERVVLLPDTRLCYHAPADTPAIAPLPALRRGHVTFGSFNNLLKVNQRVIALWSRLLHAVPDARLFINWKTLRDARRRDELIETFARHGIPPERLDLRGGHNDPAAVFADYLDVDIGLDTLPYSGGITTCEALWMGVPVVTLIGERPVGRQSAAILSAAGLADWVTHSEDEFVELAAKWAADIQRLAELRDGLRDQLLRSPLCDAGALTRHLEDTYRTLWQRWRASTS